MTAPVIASAAAAEPPGPTYRSSFDRPGDLSSWSYLPSCALSNPGTGGNPGG